MLQIINSHIAKRSDETTVTLGSITVNAYTSQNVGISSSSVLLLKETAIMRAALARSANETATMQDAVEMVERAATGTAT